MDKKNILVVGIGNYLMGDDGLGIHVIKKLQDEKLPDNVELVDGGTKGLNLMNYFENKQLAIIIDAINMEKKPGELIIIEGENVNKFFKIKYSVHEIGLVDLFDSLMLLDMLPEKIFLIGLQPWKIALQTELSEPLEKNLHLVINKVKEIINA